MTEKEKPGRFIELGKDMFTYGLMAGISQVTSLLLLPILTRVFSVDEYGTIDFIATITSVVSIFARLSLPTALVRYFYEYDTASERNSLITTLITFVVLVSFVFLGLGGVLSDFLAGALLDNSTYGPFIFLGLLTAMFQAIASVPMMALRMERHIIKYNLANILYSVSYVGIALYLVLQLSLGLQGVFLASAIAGFLQLFFSLIWVRRHLTSKLSASKLWRAVKYGIGVVPSVLVTWINSQTDRIILFTYLGLSGVGIFGAASKLALAIKLPTSIFQQAWSPHAMSVLHLSDRGNFYRRAMNYFAGAFACLGLILTAASPELLSILVPEEYYQGIAVVPWVIGATILHASGSLTSLGVQVSEKSYAASIAAWIGAGLNILFALILIGSFGIQGAAIGMFLAELAFTGTLWYFTYRYSEVRFQYKNLLVVLTTYILASNLFIHLSSWVNTPLHSIALRLVLLAIAIAIIAPRTIDEKARHTIGTTIKSVKSRFNL